MITKGIYSAAVCIVFGLFILFSCESHRPSVTRRNLRMPELIDFDRFKANLPISGFDSLREHSKKQRYLTPLLQYYFSIDKNGNIIGDTIDIPSDTYYVLCGGKKYWFYF